MPDSKLTILDGGMGQELIARSGVTTSLWAVQALLDDPELVGTVHKDFFDAGAEVATTNTYSLLPDRMESHGMLAHFEALQQLALDMAVRARDAHGSGLVPGSLGPLGFSYQPDKCPPPTEAAEIYDRVCRIQKEYIDVFLAETMSSIDQARGALMAMTSHGKPAWVAFSVDDEDGTQLRSGEPVSAVKELVDEFKPAAVLINCSVPEAVSVAVRQLRELHIPIGAYANGFRSIAEGFNHVGATVDLLEKRSDLDPLTYAGFAEEWRHDGASIIGGCCEVGPAHIRELKRRLG